MKQLDEFLKQYGDEYPESTRNMIENNFDDWLQDPIASPAVITQLYGEFGLLQPHQDLYLAFLNELKKTHSLEKDIVEIGGGYLPILGEYIAKEQLRIGKGTITIYDPHLIRKESPYPNLKLVKEPLHIDTNTKPYDLIIGQFPCQGTEIAIQKACKDHADFFIHLCSCIHFPDKILKLPFFSPTVNKYHRYVMRKTKHSLKQYQTGKLEKTYLPKEYEVKTPILYNRR